MEDVKVSFFKIASCGYYRHGKRNEPVFGSVEQTLQQLTQWGQSKRLGHTKTYDLRDGGSGLQAYLVGVTRLDDAWLLTLWNEAHNTDGTVTSIDGNATVGAADVSESEVEEGHIPGHATYFWFLPSVGLVASVRFQHRTAGTYEMNKYLTNFLSAFTPHVVLGTPDEDDQIKVIGYRQDDNSTPQNFRPAFRAEVFKKPGPIDYLVGNSARIRKIKKKETLNLRLQPNRSLWQKLLVNVRLANHSTVEQEVDIQYQLEVNGLSAEEVRGIAAEWQESEMEDADYGFVLVGDNTTHWLGHEYARDTLQLDVARENTELVNPENLLRELARNRTHLMTLVQ